MPLNLIFMGTPEFAVPALAALHGAGHNVVAVYTQPPRPAGRGKKETPSPVHQWALARDLPVHTPVSLKPAEAQSAFAAHGADVAVVAAYGLILPQAILDATPLGCINIHPSLLPRWRGAAPIQRTLLAGDSRTGVCIMQMEAGLDTGPVLLREEYAIPAGMNAGALHDVMSVMGAKLVVDTLPMLAAGTIQPEVQAAGGVTYAHKITKEEARIDWRKKALEIHHHIRAFSPSPGASFVFGNEIIKIFEAELIPHDGISNTPGGVCDNALLIACENGFIRPRVVQRAGKSRMSAEEMLKGFPIPRGAQLELPNAAL